MEMDRKAAVKAIKERLNIADLVRRYVELRQNGSRAMGCCPFHQEKTPSFSVNADEGFFYCFGCQASGDIFDFHARINGLEFKEALEQLAEECGITLERGGHSGKSGGQSGSLEKSRKQQALAMHELAKLHFVQNLKSPDGAGARAYLSGRELSPEVIRRFELGWSKPGWNSLHDALRKSGFKPEEAAQCGLLAKSERGSFYDRFRERLMFPIRNLAGKVVAFGGRVIGKTDDQAKYINSSDSPIYKKGEHLYGLFESRRAISQERSIVLTEGYMDVISLHQFGIENSCGVLGTALTPEQVKRLGQLSSKLVLIFDGDTAGRKAALRAAEMILTKGLACTVVLMPDGEDIDSFLHKEGKDAFVRLRESAPDGFDFCLSVLQREFAIKDQLEWAGKFLGQIPVAQPGDASLKSHYFTAFTYGLGVKEETLREVMSKLSPGAAGAQRFAAGRGQTEERRTSADDLIDEAPYGRNEQYYVQAVQAVQATGKPYAAWKNQALGTGGPAARHSQNSGFNNKRDGAPGARKNFAGSGWSGGKKNNSEAVPAALPMMPPPESMLEQQLMKFVVRYPRHLLKLRELGAEWFITTAFAKGLWNKLVKYGHEYSPAEVAAILTDKEKDFWIRCRIADNLPKDKEEQELQDVCATLTQSHRREHGKTCLSALRQMKGDSGADIDLLKALQETLRRSDE